MYIGQMKDEYKYSNLPNCYKKYLKIKTGKYPLEKPQLNRHTNSNNKE